MAGSRRRGTRAPRALVEFRLSHSERISLSSGRSSRSRINARRTYERAVLSVQSKMSAISL